MHRPRILAGMFLLIASTGAPAQSPYTISGLHLDLVLGAAVSQAEKLGGRCEVNASRANESGKSVQCEYSHCVKSAMTDGCEEEESSGTGPTVASYPIASILLEAPDDATTLTRIVMAYKGDTDAVAAGLIEAFGPADAGGAPTGKKSWSHARRWNWTQGHYRAGLLDSPQLIILAIDPALNSTGAGSQPEAAP
ncbi:MAG: hypothetical protein KDI33_10510 [Halioglobus sp.]|nr:hypothetical protein [Halioglobus sp.]